MKLFTELYKEVMRFVVRELAVIDGISISATEPWKCIPPSSLLEIPVFYSAAFAQKYLYFPSTAFILAADKQVE